MPFTIYIPFNCSVSIELGFSSSVEDSCQVDVEGHGELFGCNNQVGPDHGNNHVFTWRNTETDLLHPSQPKYPNGERVDIHVKTKGVKGPSNEEWTELAGDPGATGAGGVFTQTYHDGTGGSVSVKATIAVISTLSMKLKEGERLLSLTYMDRDGNVYISRSATKKEVERWRKEGLIDSEDGTCTCGDADFCDDINGVWVRCFEDADGVCNWHSTNNVC